MKRKTKTLLIGAFLGICLFLIFSVIFMIISNKSKTNLSVKTEKPKIELYKIICDISKDDEISPENIESIFIEETEELKNIAFSINKNKKIYATQDIASGSLLQKNMIKLYSDIKKDLRYFELQGLMIPMMMKKGDVVDIRISFPTGADFVVLSKKQVIDIIEVGDEEYNEEYTILKLDEEEILRLQCAVVDAWLQKEGLLYATIYVDPLSQEAIEVTYPVSDIVKEIIENDPNIVNFSMSMARENQRKTLEKNLEQLDENKLSIEKRKYARKKIKSVEE